MELPRSSLRMLSRVKQWRHTTMFVLLMGAFFGSLVWKMGAANMTRTLTTTAYSLLMDTVFYTMAITVLAGAAGRLTGEFGLMGLLNSIFSRLMGPLYGLPGISAFGAAATFLSDNMAVIPFSRDREFMSHFTPRQTPLLCNLGTSYGMGLFVVTVLVSLGWGKEAVIGLAAALLGSVVSVRLMAWLAARQAKGDWTPERAEVHTDEATESGSKPRNSKLIHAAEEKGFGERFLVATLEGGKYGVEIGLNMVPGVLIICTAVMLLTKGMPAGGYSGGAYEGIAFIPAIGAKLRPVLEPLFGFTSKEAIALPVTALGSVGAAVSLAQSYTKSGILSGNEVAVFAAFGILWSGFLSTHVAILDMLGYRRLVAAAIWSHLAAGLVAGIVANLLYHALRFAGWV